MINKINDNFDREGKQFSFSKCVTSSNDFSAWQEDFRNALIDHLKIRDMLETRDDIVVIKGNPKWNSETPTYHIEHFYLKSWQDTLIPVLLTIPKSLQLGDRVPAMICTHGHGQSKELILGRVKRKGAEREVWAKDFAELGCITITMDQWGWNERGGTVWKKQLPPNYDSSEGRYALNMLLLGRTINGLRYFDTMRQVDYLLTREDVEPDRIGIAGLSLGGATAGFVACLDPRIKLACVAGYLNTFKDSLIALNHCSCSFIPELATLGEISDYFSLITPNPVCFITGVKDDIFPVEPAKRAFEEIKKVYQMLGAEENCVLDITPFGHTWRKDVALPFVKKHFFS